MLEKGIFFRLNEQKLVSTGLDANQVLFLEGPS
jgi:hypothetical protein